MNDYAKKLKDLKKEKEFLVCIDSDGCAIDTMEIKHKNCFGPKMIEIWNLDQIAEDVLEVWNFVNLYSKWRGINRFKGLVKVFELLRNKNNARVIEIPDIESLQKWVDSTEKLSNPALEAMVIESNDACLEKALMWSREVNESIYNMDTDNPPFPYARESMKLIQKYADAVVVSSANEEALYKEWNQHNIAQYVKVMAGQEMGSKTVCIGHAKNNRYDNDNVIMIGDAPGDLKAAKDNNVLYYPIITGKENESWKRFYEEAFDKFIDGRYRGKYQDDLIDEFNKVLPSSLPWK